MQDDEVVRLAGAEHAIGPVAETALDGLFDFGEQVHGRINPSLAAASMIWAAAGAAAVPPYTPFSTSTETAIFRPAPLYGAKPMNQACDGASASSAVPVLP